MRWAAFFLLGFGHLNTTPSHANHAANDPGAPARAAAPAATAHGEESCRASDPFRWSKGTVVLPAENTVSRATLDDRFAQAHAKARYDKSPQSITQRNWLFLLQAKANLREQIHEMAEDTPPTVRAAQMKTRELLAHVEAATETFRTRAARGEVTHAVYTNLSTALAALGTFETTPLPFPDKNLEGLAPRLDAFSKVGPPGGDLVRDQCQDLVDASRRLIERRRKVGPTPEQIAELRAQSDAAGLTRALVTLQKGMRLNYDQSQSWENAPSAQRRQELESAIRALSDPLVHSLMTCLDHKGEGLWPVFARLAEFSADLAPTEGGPHVREVFHAPGACFQTAFHRTREGLLGQLTREVHRSSPALVEGVVPSSAPPNFARLRAVAAQVEGSGGLLNPDTFSLQRNRPTCVADALVNQITRTTGAGAGTDRDTVFRLLGGREREGVPDPLAALENWKRNGTSLPVAACGPAPAGSVQLVDYEFARNIHQHPRETFELLRGLLAGGGQATPIAWINSDFVRDQGGWREYHTGLQNFSHAVLIVGYGTAVDPETGKPTDYLEIEDSLQTTPAPGMGPVRHRVRASKFLRDNFDAQGGLLLTAFRTRQ